MSEAFVHYRIDNEQSSVKNRNKVYCICDEFKYMEKFLEEHPYLKSKLLYLKNYLKYYLYNWNLRRLEAKFRLRFLLRYSSEFRKEFSQHAIDKAYFSLEQYKELKKITKHPIIYYITRKLYRKELR